VRGSLKCPPGGRALLVDINEPLGKVLRIHPGIRHVAHLMEKLSTVNTCDVIWVYV